MSDLKIIKTRIYLDGKDMGLHGVKIQGGLSNDLPGRFSSGDATPQRTGTITWSPSNTIFKDVSPLDADYPHAGARVLVIDETTSSKRTIFTGVIDTTTGGMGKPLESEIVDDSDKLSAAVSWYPLLRRMPRRQNTNWGSSSPGAHVSYALAEVAKQCGFGAEYPEFRGSYAIYSPLSGSMFTNSLKSEGAWIAGGRTYEGTAYPVFSGNYGAARGLMIGAGGWDNPKYSNLAGSGVWLEVEVVSADATTYMWAGVRLNGAQIQIGLTESAVWVNLGENRHQVASGITGTHVIGFFYPANVGESIWARIDDQYYETPITRTSATNTVISVSSVVSSLTPNDTPYFLVKDGAGALRDFVVSIMTSSQSTAAWWKRITGSRLPNRTRMYVGDLPEIAYLPSVEAETGKNAISQIAEVFCISSWIDGEGYLNFVTGRNLRNKTSSLALTESEFSPLEWESKYRHACSEVTLKGSNYEVSMSGTGNPIQEVWSGSTSENLDNKEYLTWWYKVDDDEDVFEVDTTPKSLNRIYDSAKPNVADAKKDKSFWGWNSIFAAAKNDAPDSASEKYKLDATPGGRVSCWVDRISTRTYKIRMRKGDDYKVDCSPQYPEELNGALNINLELRGVPILRAGAKVVHVDANNETFQADGPAGAPLVHDMGVYFQDGKAYMKQVLSDYFSSPHPYFRDVSTRFDTRIDIGSVITLDASQRWGRTFRVLVTGVSHDSLAGTTTFTPRVLGAGRTSMTWLEVEEAMKANNVTWADWQKKMDGKVTWAQLEANPGKYVEVD